VLAYRAWQSSSAAARCGFWRRRRRWVARRSQPKRDCSWGWRGSPRPLCRPPWALLRWSSRSPPPSAPSACLHRNPHPNPTQALVHLTALKQAALFLRQRPLAFCFHPLCPEVVWSCLTAAGGHPTGRVPGWLGARPPAQTPSALKGSVRRRGPTGDGPPVDVRGSYGCGGGRKEEWGRNILTISALAIVIAAPLGAVAITTAGPLMLSKQ
jgi:hypothetical protein